MLTCKEMIMDLLSDYLDESLSPEMLDEFERHLAVCRPCVAYLETYKETRDLVSRGARAQMPEEMKQLLRPFLLKQLTREKS